MFATDYYESMMLNTLRGTTATAPTKIYMGLFLSNPGETGTGGTEVSYTGYQRQEVTFSAPAVLSGGIGFQNIADITFPTTSVALGSVTHVGILDSQTGGNMLLYGEFTEALTVEANESPVVASGEAQWWITGGMSTAYKTKMLNLLRGTSVSGFSPYLAIYNGSPEDGGAELSGDNDARSAITFSAPASQVGGQSQIANSGRLATPRASTSWGTMTHIAVMDASTSGQPVFYASRSAKAFRKGMMLIYEDGTLKLSIN